MVKGLIVDADYDNAENTKLIMEDSIKNLRMDIFKPREEGVTLLPIDNYDFIITSEAPVKKHIIDKETVPFVNKVLNGKSDYITVRKNREVLFIDRNAIIGVEVMGKHCYIYTLENKVVITRITLHDLIDLIEIPTLLRCHKSFAVNLSYVSGIKREGRNKWRPRYIVDTEFEGYISDRYIKHIIDVFEETKDITITKYIGE